MRYILYGDVYFLVNFSVDVLALVLCGCFLRIRRRVWRILPAAFLGALYALLALLLPPLPFVALLGLHLLAAALVCVVAYGGFGPAFFLRLLCGFYAVSVLLGGAVSALYSMLAQAFSDSLNGGGSAKKAEIFLLFALLSGVIIHIGGRVLSAHSLARTVYVEVECTGKRVRFTGLSDSGNLLTDPLSGKAVIVVRREAIAPLLPSVCFRLLSGEGEGIPLALRRRLRVVVAHGIGGGRAMLGYLPDCILLSQTEDGKERRAVDALLAVCEDDATDLRGFAAIVPTSLVG